MRPRQGRRESDEAYADRIKAWRKEGRFDDADREDAEALALCPIARLYDDIGERIRALQERRRQLWLELTDEEREGRQPPDHFLDPDRFRRALGVTS